jgi:hypothetical protein
VTELEVAPVPRSLFRQGLEPGHNAGSHQGFRLIRLDEVGTVASYVPPLPTWLPQGFTLARVVYAADLPWGAWADYPDRPAREVFVAVYRRDFAYFVVTTRRADDTIRLTDPECLDVCEPGETYISAGGPSFQTAAARPGAVTHAWGEANGIRITVDGDLTVADLKGILDSLPLSP